MDVAGELREPQVEEPMQLALAIAEVLTQAIPVAQPFAQLLGGRIGQATGRRPFLRGKPRDA